MSLEQAMRILHIVKCDLLGYCRDLSYTPSKDEIRQAFEVAEKHLENAS